MILADLPTVVTDIGIAFGVVGAIIATMGAIGKARPGRWVWRTLVTDPIGGWLDHRITAPLEPINEKLDALGSRDRELNQALIDHMADAVRIREDDLAERRERQAQQDERHETVMARLDAVDQRLDVGERRFDEFSAKLDQALAHPATAQIHAPVEIRPKGDG